METIKYTCFSLLFLFPVIVTAQLQIERDVIAASGTSTHGDLIMDGTMGELIIGYDAGSDLIVTSGFHQVLSPMTFVPHPEIESLKIYPNPTADRFNLTGNANAQFLKLELLDAQGKVVYSTFMNSINKELNISALSPGLYILLIRNKEGTIIEVRNIVNVN